MRKKMLYNTICPSKLKSQLDCGHPSMKKILLIEDEGLLADMYKAKFEKAGFKVLLALNVPEGIETAREEKPDLIILDILLPDENGISFLKKLRKMPAIADTPVVALSNYDDPQAKKEAYALGVKGYLIKALFTPRELVEEIEKYLPN
jgi:two-component system alkaline phosphatase synthesis response regulator PhoP